MKRLIPLGSLLVLLASQPILAADASPGVLQNVKVFPAGGEVRVEITLSTAVVPSVEIAHIPERLVVKFPGTVVPSQQKRIAVHQYGVQTIRFGLNRPDPPETHLIVDLDEEHPYKMTTDGTKIILLIQPSLQAAARRRNAPPTAAAKSLLSSLGREESGNRTLSSQENAQGSLLIPPSSGPPIQFPQSPRANSSPSPVAAPGPAVAEVAAAPVTSSTTSQPAGPQAEREPAEAESATALATTAAPAEPAPAAQPGAHGSGMGRVPLASQPQGVNPDFRTAFRVKYVAQDTAYLDGGRSVGLTEGMKLVVRDLPNVGGVAAEGADSGAAGDVAELEVLSVAANSAVTEIHTPKRPVKVGDVAYLSSSDQQALVEKTTLSATRKYPAVVSFTENDTLDEEARAVVPRPPSPAVNRSRGRIGFDYIGVLDHGVSNLYTSEVGLVLRTDITRIAGTYWNASGYWNGRFTHTNNTGPQTLQDLINRTYTLYTSYENPNSSYVAGFGRLYLPYATSLDTIDGGYAGRKLKQGVTTGIFLGTTPNPTSYSYAPNRQMVGAFINFEGGSYEDLHYTSTTGGGMQLLSWAPDRPFLFFENGISYKRVFSIYQAAQIDSHASHAYTCPTSFVSIPQCAGEINSGGTYTGGTYTQAGTNWGLGRSFTTVRFSPHPRIEFSVNNTYYRDLPFVDPTALASGSIGAGLFDKFLSQGTMAGTRVEVLKQIWLSADLGLSSFSGESKNSLNKMFGISFGHVPWIGAHVDARYSRFNSTFGSGSYETLGFSRNLSERLQFQLLGGQQNFASSLTTADRSRFVNGLIESNLGRHYFIQGGGTISRGNQMNYDQWIFTFGYRFDNRQGQKAK